MKNVAFTISGEGNINLSLDFHSYPINTDHINYQKIVECLNKKQYGKLLSLVDAGKVITAKSKGSISVRNGIVYHGNSVLHHVLADKVRTFHEKGLPYEPLVEFIKNLFQNENENSKEQAYRFLEFNNLPITPDGCILFYKRVNDNYTDIHTGKFDNHVGKRVWMLRTEVNHDPSVTCSAGLHVCSLGYLKSFGQGKKIVICKVNPAHIVSVPTDYQNTKVRVSEYIVVGEWTSDEVDAFDGDLIRNADTSKYTPADEEGDYDDLMDEAADSTPVPIDDYGFKPNGHKFHNVRDAKGHFIKKATPAPSAPKAPKASPKVAKAVKAVFRLKPNGSKFHNVRDAKGHFIKRK